MSVKSETQVKRKHGSYWLLTTFQIKRINFYKTQSYTWRNKNITQILLLHIRPQDNNHTHMRKGKQTQKKKRQGDHNYLPTHLQKLKSKLDSSQLQIGWYEWTPPQRKKNIFVYYILLEEELQKSHSYIAIRTPNGVHCLSVTCRFARL